MRTGYQLDTIKPGMKMSIHCALSVNGGSELIDVYDDDIVNNTFTIKEATSNSGEITVGGAIMGTLRFSLWNDTGKFDNIDWRNMVISVWMSVDDTSVPGLVRFGDYIVSSHSSSGDTIDIEAGDMFSVLDKHTLSELNLNWSEGFYSATRLITDIINLDKDFSIIEASNTSVLSNVFVYDPGSYNMSLRDAVSWIAQCAGVYALMLPTTNDATRQSTLLFDWYEGVPYDVGTTFSHSLRTDDVTVTGVRVSAYEVDAEGNEIVETRGTEEYMLDISGNPFISAENVSDVADKIFANVNGMTFRPGSFTVPADPKIRAGDPIIINTRQEKNLATIVTNLTYRPSRVQESITADADTVSDLQVVQKKTQNASYIDQTARRVVASMGGSGSGSGGSSLEAGTFISGSDSNFSWSGDFVKMPGEHWILHGTLKCNLKATSISANKRFTLSLLDGSQSIYNTYQCVSGYITYPLNGGMTGSAAVDHILIKGTSQTTLQISFRDAVSVSAMGPPTIYIPITLYG